MAQEISKSTLLTYTSNPHITPRTAQVLIAAIGILEDEENELLDGTDYRWREDSFTWLPETVRHYSGHYQNRGFYGRLIDECTYLYESLTSGTLELWPTVPQNMAQQVILDRAIHEAEFLQTEYPDIFDTRGLPEYSTDRPTANEDEYLALDYDWDYAKSVLLDDTDHLLLEDADFKEVDYELHLHPANWLVPFTIYPPSVRYGYTRFHRRDQWGGWYG